jgi:hypothetical protein
VAQSWPKRWVLGQERQPLESLSRLADEPVEADTVVALGALLKLGVNVHRHLRVGVADLIHHPLHIEVVGEERDRDVGAPQRVRCDTGKWLQALATQFPARLCAASLMISATRWRLMRPPLVF